MSASCEFARNVQGGNAYAVNWAAVQLGACVIVFVCGANLGTVLKSVPTLVCSTLQFVKISVLLPLLCRFHASVHCTALCSVFWRVRYLLVCVP